MSYTPTNWQTGDTITAEKLNKMEGGIALAGNSVETAPVTLIPQQSVSAVSVQGMPAYLAQISGDIVAPNIGDTVTVTYDGTDYTVVAADYLGQAVMLGEASDGAPVFSNYPFMAFFAEGQQGLYCETSGSHTIKAVGEQETVVPSDYFKAAVLACLSDNE